MKSRPIDSRRAGENNEKLILRLLRKHGSLSQSQLCRLTGLGSSTASSIVSRLRDKGLVLENEGESTRRGPKPVILSINPRGRFIAGVEVNPDLIHIGLFDFATELIDTVKVPLDRDHSVDRVVHLLVAQLEALFERHGVVQTQVLGVGIALSGTVSKDGHVVLSSPMGWKDVPFRAWLDEHLHCPVCLFSTRVRLLAEMALESNGGYKNVVYINVADGVGCSAVMEGQLLQGATGRGGEIGHVIVAPEGPLCGCGHRGCLEAVISGPALAEKILMELMGDRSSPLQQAIGPGDNHKTVIQKWGQALTRGDAYALEIRQYVESYLGKAVALAVNLYDPEMVILGGYVTNACFDAIRAAVERTIDSSVYNSDSRAITLRPASVGERSLIIGTAMAIWQREVEL